MTPSAADPLASMPRGGPHAGRLSRAFDTDALEYLDRDDVPDRWKHQITRGLDRLHRLLGTYRWLTRRVLESADAADAPRILELGAGDGGLSRHLLAAHDKVLVTVSDLDHGAVARMAASDLGAHPRAEVRSIDATTIDAPDQQWDAAVFALSFHHLPPPAAARVIAEATRVARRLVLVDAWREPLTLLPVPLYPVLGGWPMVHDGVISARRMYSAAALRHLAARCGAPVTIDISFQLPGFLVAVAERTAD